MAFFSCAKKYQKAKKAKSCLRSVYLHFAMVTSFVLGFVQAEKDRFCLRKFSSDSGLPKVSLATCNFKNEKFGAMLFADIKGLQPKQFALFAPVYSSLKA